MSETEEKDEPATAKSPIDGWTLLGGAAAISAGVVSIGLKTDSDRIYDIYFYVVGLVVAVFVARDLGVLKVDPLRLLGVGPRPGE